MQPRPRWRTLLAAAYLLLTGCVAAIAAGLTVVSSQRLDLVPLFIFAAAAVLLVASAVWLLGSRRRIPALVVPFGAVAGVLAGLAPMAAVVSLIGASYLTAGPVELGFGLVMVAWAVGSAAIAIRAWRAHGAAPAPDAQPRARP